MTLDLSMDEIAVLIGAINQTLEDSRQRIADLQGKTDTASVESLQNYEQMNTALVALQNKIWNHAYPVDTQD